MLVGAGRNNHEAGRFLVGAVVSWSEQSSGRSVFGRFLVGPIMGPVEFGSVFGRNNHGARPFLVGAVVSWSEQSWPYAPKMT